jgi:hypothetical protein
MTDIPLFGFGLDYQYSDKYPGGIKSLCGKYYEKLSHISIVSLTSSEDALYFKNYVANGLRIIHHLSGIAPCDPVGPHLELLRKQSNLSTILSAEWCLEDIGIWSIGPYSIPYFAPPLFDKRVATVVAKRIKKIINQVNIPFLAEIPSCSFVIGNQSLGEFFHQIVSETNCGIVLDVSHVFSYSLATNQDPMYVLESLPLDAAREIHIAGGKISVKHANRYIDTHSDPIMTEVKEILKQSIICCPNLQAITYEIGINSSEELIDKEVIGLETILRDSKFRPKFCN